jgi:glycerol-3-phosphate dehydrogenase subunit C
MKIDPRPNAPPAIDYRSDRFWDARDLEQETKRVFEICHGCRMCVNYCGSFPDMFARVDRDIEKNGATGAEKLSHDDFTSVTDLCWQCKLCYIKCPYTADEGHPWLVDVPRLLTRHKAQRARRDGISLQDKVLGEPQALGSFAAGPLAPLANFVNANRLIRKVNEKVIGISASFPTPTFATHSFEKWLAHHEPLPRAGERGTVSLFATCTGDYNYPSIPANAVRVLEHNGYRVERPPQTCCGLPNLDGGDVAAGTAKAQFNVESLLAEIEAGRRVVVVGPSCSYMIRKEYPDLLGTTKAETVARGTLDVMEFLEGLRKDKTLEKNFTSGLGKVAYHAPCHLRAQKIGFPGARLLGLLPDTEVEVIEQCSAVDGTWGMKTEHYEMGRKYAQKLVRDVEAMEPKHVVSDCPLSMLRIRKENERGVLHPIEALAHAYGIAVGVDESGSTRRDFA